MDNTQDVMSAESSPATAGYEPARVSGDRPVENLAGEFNRKFGSLASKVDQLTNLVAASIQAQQPAPSGSTVDLSRMTDDQLWDESVKGNKDAFTLRERRIAMDTVQRHEAVKSEMQMIEGQVAAIANKYPVLRDGNHPLSQHVNLAYNLLQRRGRPANSATWLEAAKTAITDRPDLVSDIHSQTARASESSRRRSVNSQTAPAHRDQPASESYNFRTTKEDAQLANRMGVRNPDEAKKRFLQRQAEGRSSFGQVAGNISLEDL